MPSSIVTQTNVGLKKIPVAENLTDFVLSVKPVITLDFRMTRHAK